MHTHTHTSFCFFDHSLKRYKHAKVFVKSLQVTYIHCGICNCLAITKYNVWQGVTIKQTIIYHVTIDHVTRNHSS